MGTLGEDITDRRQKEMQHGWRDCISHMKQDSYVLYVH